ncbi:MAG: toll/interleukin-1 receptor domain-containing protein, partial [Phototrophicales bacterium]
MSHVFISYSSKDRKFVESLIVELRNLGVRTWIDIYDIKPGDNWANAIRDALDNADAIVVIISETSLHSEYVQF